MLRKIGISVLIVLGLLGVLYVISLSFFQNIAGLQSYNEITKNFLLMCTRFIVFGILLGVPSIVRLIKREGRWTIDFYYVLLPVVLLILVIMPLITKNYMAQQYFFIDGFSLYFVWVMSIAFGFSLTLLVNKEEIQEH